MSKRAKFFLGLFPAVLLIIVAEATVPALIASLAVWMTGADGFLGSAVAFCFWIATFVAIPATMIPAIGAIYVDMVILNSPDAVRNRTNTPIVPIRRGPN